MKRGCKILCNIFKEKSHIPLLVKVLVPFGISIQKCNYYNFFTTKQRLLFFIVKKRYKYII